VVSVARQSTIVSRVRRTYFPDDALQLAVELRGIGLEAVMSRDNHDRRLSAVLSNLDGVVGVETNPRSLDLTVHILIDVDVDRA
jgi:hypothetical protein